MVLDLRDVTIRRGGTTILDSVSWTVADGERWVVLGPNGAGKTTLLQLASGRMHPTSGTATVLGCPRSGASAPKRSGAASSCLRRWDRGPPTAARRPRSTTPSQGWSCRRAGWSRPADPAPCADPNPPQHAPAERLAPGHVFGCPTKPGSTDG